MIAKWWQTIKVGLVNHMAYKLNFFLMVIGPALVFFFVKYNVWSAIYSVKEDLQIQGYSFQQMITYQIWVLIVGLIAIGHSSLNLAIDIRMGHISKYLIYPFEFWQYHTASFIAFQAIQHLVALVTLSILVLTGFIDQFSIYNLAVGVLYCNLVSLLWYFTQYMIGVLAFWLEETWVLRVMFMMLTSFFSGGVFPLEIFPQALSEFLFFTPFPYMTYVPVKIIMGSYEGSIATATSVLAVWTGVFFLAARMLWKTGMRTYSAAGM